MSAALFDMDGVLVDSEEYWHDFERELLEEVVEGEPPSLDSIMGMPYREIYDHLEETVDVAIDRRDFLRRYDEAATAIYAERVSLLDGFPDLRDELRARDVPVAIVSSSPHDWIGAVTARFELDLDGAWSVDDVDAPGKPAPHVYEHAAGEFGVAPADCVVVEDSRNGVLAGSRAGATVIGYRAEHNPDQDLSAADVVVEGPAALGEEILGLL